MKVALVHDARFPVAGYGGTERAVWWLAKGLAELGVRVTLACREGSRHPFGEVLHPDYSRPLDRQLEGFDVLHFFNTPPESLRHPHLVTIEGNGKPGESFLVNTVFVSADHARRHGAVCHVHNGIDPDDYRFGTRKEDYAVFLAKASWRVKNVRGAIRLARRARLPLRVMGGDRWLLNPWRGVRWEGMVDGEHKCRLLSGARGLLFPVLWHEPFGIAVVEALVSGTPVLATPFGSLPELVGPGVGRLCRSEEEFLEAIRELPRFSPEACRAWALEKFHYRLMAERYRDLYGKVSRGEALNPEPPRAREAPERGCALPARTP